MTFNFTITTTSEVKESEIHYDLAEIGKFVNKKLTGNFFGSSVDEFYLGYEVADSKGHMKHYEQTANMRRYGRRYLLIVKQFDYQDLKGKAALAQFAILKTKILEAIMDTEKLSKKPKDFDKEKFHDVISKILNDYEKIAWPL